MKIRVLGAGWYGCSLSLALIKDGHDVEIHESADHIFAGASGANPARCHLGFHYPRSQTTRAMCQRNSAEFMATYGHLTRSIPVNIYAIADKDSLLDFGTYCQLLKDEVEFITIRDPREFGLFNVEGALLTGERHIVINKARLFFEKELDGRVQFKIPIATVDSPKWDMSIDCTFCANDAENIDRFEPCIMGLVEGAADRATTIMDGPFGSIYPWDEDEGLSSLTSALLTPLSKTCKSWQSAKEVLRGAWPTGLKMRCEEMMAQMAHYWPECRDLYRVVDHRLAIRALPRSAADERLVDVVRVGERAIRVRAGKIDAIFHAENLVRKFISDMTRDDG